MTIKTLSFLWLMSLLDYSYSAVPPTATGAPHIPRSFQIKSNLNQQTAGNCVYTVVIKTSCSSPSYTRDRVSLAFGDQYGNEVYAARLDDPGSRTFERCSTDTFQINGACTYDICYQYLLRSGPDGWKPESVLITGPNRRPTTFYYNTFLPNGVWFGYNLCRGVTVNAAVI
uniref:Embryo-specific protein 3 n=1 Tax=Kalanchoe fedtschenkoi TaxID=63787 RepID=A0A7N0ZYH9_KALFE